MAGRAHGRIASVAACIALSGCITSPGDADDTAPVEAGSLMRGLERALVDDHDHRDPSAHPAFVRGASVVHRMPFLPERGPPAHPHEASKVLDGYYYQAMQDPPSGVAIYDVSDPALPRFVSLYDAGVSWNTGLDVSPDGRWLFVTAEWVFGLPGPPAAMVTNQVRGAAEGPSALMGQTGIHIVDVTDKASPRLVLVQPGPHTGYHKVAVADVGGALHVFASAFVGNVGVDIYRFETAPVPHLVLVANYGDGPTGDAQQSIVLDEVGPGDSQNARTAHDVYVEPDPIDGSPLLVVSYWAAGVHFVDVSDPSAPRLLGVWDDFTGVESGSVMTAHVTNVEGRRIAVAIPELIGTYGRQGIVWVVDATDFSAPELVGTWELPGVHPQTEPLLWSTHNFVIRDNKIHLAHWHAGAYVLDIGTMEMAAEPVLRAVIMPAGIDPAGPWPFMRATDAMEVALVGDHLYVAGPDLVVTRLDPEITRAPTETAVR